MEQQIKVTSVPKQLNKAFFKNALQNGLHDSQIDIKEFEFISQSEDSNKNNWSQIYHVSIVYVRKDNPDPEMIALSVKVTPRHEGLDVSDVIHAFNKEKWLLLDIMPQFEILLNDIKFAPRCYYATNSPLQTLVLEDLENLGFQFTRRQTGPDKRHTLLALKKLAQFHAVSMAFAKKRLFMMKDYESGLLDVKVINPSTSFYELIQRNLKFTIKTISKLKDFDEITQKLTEFLKNFEQRIIACKPKPNKGDINVLNHGDFRIDNLLFKYDERNNPIDLVFLDFQLSIFGSLGIDLNYFLFGTVELEILEDWKALLEIYHASLRDTLSKLCFDKIPSYADIEKEFKQKSAYGFFTLIGPFPIIWNMDENLRTQDLFSSEEFIKRLKYSLVLLDEMGAF